MGKHLVGEIESVDRSCTALLASKSMQCHRHVARAGTEIKHDLILLLENVREDAGGASPPEAIYVHGQRVVGEVIARSDLIEHLLYGTSRRLFVGGAGWCGAFY